MPSHRVAGAAARPQGRHSCGWRSCCRTKRGAAGPTEPERRIAARVGIEQRGRAGRRVAGRDRALDLEGQAARAPRGRHRAAAARAGREPKRSACSAATCTTCCSPRPPDSASTMGLDPGHPHRRQGRRSSTAPASCSTPRRSIRTSRARTGTARCARWPRSARATACSSSRSATARRRARPTSSPAT